MHIALFHNAPSGGAKRAVYEWTCRLAQNHQIDVYTLSSANHDFCDIRPFVQNHYVFEFTTHRLFNSPWGRLNQFQRWRDLGQLTKIGYQLAAQINSGGYDVLFANSCAMTSIPPLLQYIEIPSLYYLHEPFGRGFFRQIKRPYLSNDHHWRGIVDRFDPFIRMYFRRLGSIQRKSIQNTKRLLANSQFTRERIYSEFGTDAVFSPYGVNLDGFQILGNSSRANYVLSVGEMSPRKGFDFVIESLAEIPADRRPALKLACNMVNQHELGYVKRLAERSGVDLEVFFNLGVAELRLLYNQARICVYAPVMEPFGLVPLEAMACGTPVVGVCEGGVPESIVHEYTGLIVERDAEKFGAAIWYLLTNPDLAEAYGRNGRQHVLKNWTWETSVSVLSSHLAACAERSN